MLFFAGLFEPVKSGNICLSSSAGMELNMLISGGMSGKEAFAIVEEEYLDGTRRCFYMMKGEVNDIKSTWPHAYRYLFQ